MVKVRGMGSRAVLIMWLVMRRVEGHVGFPVFSGLGAWVGVLV